MASSRGMITKNATTASQVTFWLIDARCGFFEIHISDMTIGMDSVLGETRHSEEEI